MNIFGQIQLQNSASADTEAVRKAEFDAGITATENYADSAAQTAAGTAQSNAENYADNAAQTAGQTAQVNAESYADEKVAAVANGGYDTAYWYGRKNTSTPFPEAPAEWGESDNTAAFDFETNTPYSWNATDGYVAGTPITPTNGFVVGISQAFLDLQVDAGKAGRAQYSTSMSRWDYYPDKYQQPDGVTIGNRASDGALEIPDGAITTPKMGFHLYQHLVSIVLTASSANIVTSIYSTDSSIINNFQTVVDFLWNNNIKYFSAAYPATGFSATTTGANRYNGIISTNGTRIEVKYGSANGDYQTIKGTDINYVSDIVIQLF